MEEKNKFSKGTFIAIAVLALCVIGLVAFIIGDKTKKKKDTDKDTEAVVTTEEVTIASTGEATQEKTEVTTEAKKEEKKDKTDKKKNPLLSSKSPVYLKIDDSGSWQNGSNYVRQFNVELYNNGDTDLDDWKVVFQMDKDVKLSDNWSGKYDLKDGNITVTAVDYNKTVKVKEMINFGFQVVYTSEDSCNKPYEIKLFNGSEEIKGKAEDESKKEDKKDEKKDDNKDDKKDTTEKKAEKKAENGSPYEVHGKLKLKGVDIVDKNGEKYQLQGVSTHGIAWFPDYVNKDAFKTFRDDWGVNLMRIAMYTDEGMGYCTDGDKEKTKKLVCDGVDYATELGMYVIVDWHILHDLTPMKYKDEAAAFFEEISSKYKNNGNVIYEICNEPNGGTSWAEVKEYAEEIIPIIRKNSPDAIIIVGTPNWSQEVDKASEDPLKFDNIMYAVHFYAATHKDDIRNKVTVARDAGCAVFISEFSICDASGNGGIDYDSAEEWMDMLDKNNISYAIWNLSNKNETSSLIDSSCDKKSGWEDDDLSETGIWYKEHLNK